ncbi:unnamed protein product [Clonostachys rosea]|uniref:Uncharacterized protein n=1 Tax=Bionectria ochroleuca TaxID=29856 RepID=A0ABY6UXT0_BIOOC|nr:unnamed protein product [Clonostachys rosea]
MDDTRTTHQVDLSASPAAPVGGTAAAAAPPIQERPSAFTTGGSVAGSAAPVEASPIGQASSALITGTEIGIPARNERRRLDRNFEIDL